MLPDYVKNNHLAIIVKPNASKTEFLGYDESREAVRISIAAPPDDGKANKELLKFLKKELGKNCELVSGKTSRKKLVRFS
ncbi:YggU family protein [Candidatus Woesearchaeota archaeon]|nr:YggU family protein [Candidatus Woesearchaeota archaeon]